MRAAAELAARSLGIAWREALEIDATVDDLCLPGSLRDGCVEPIAQPARHGDHGRSAPDHVAGRGAHSGNRADVGDVLAVGGDDERRVRRQRGGETGRHEEVGVGDVGPEVASDAPRIPEEGEVRTLPAASRAHDRTLELVAAGGELALEVRDEDAEVRVARPRIHLGDEEDPQRLYPRVTCRIPRHISSVVPSPQST